MRSEKTIRDYRKIFNTHLLDWLDRPYVRLVRIRRDWSSLHSEITKHGWDTERRVGRGRRKRKGSPYAANGMVRALRAAYLWAKREQPELALPEFPNVFLNPEMSSDKHIPLAELKQWFDAVADLPDRTAC